MKRCTGPSEKSKKSCHSDQEGINVVGSDVAQAIAEQHGVWVRPLAMRRIDLLTGRVEIVPVRAGPPEKTSVGPVQIRRDGCGWLNAARAGTWTASPPSSAPSPATNSRS